MTGTPIKAALCVTLEGDAGIEITQVEMPVPRPGEVLIEVEAIGLNFMDTLITTGRYQEKPALPFSPGGEIAGRVAALGPTAGGGFKVGDRVAAYLGWGGAREFVTTSVSALTRVPESIPMDVAAGLNVTYGTAMHALVDRSALRRGETIAVLGATSGAGLAAVEIAAQLGAKVIAVGTSPEKLRVAQERGATQVLLASKDDLRDGLRDACGGTGLEVVYDCVGGPLAEPALRALAPGGRYLVVGFASGEIPRLPLNIVMLKGCDIAGIAWGPAARQAPHRHREHIEQVMTWIADGRIKPHLHSVRPLSEAADAIRDIAARKITGKVILRP